MSDDTEEIDDHRGIQGRDGVQGIAGPRGVPGASATPEAIARAAELKKALQENTTALNRVKRRQVITWGALLGLVVAYSVLTVLFFRVRDAQDAACEAGNSVRQGLLNVADIIEENGAEPEFVAEMRVSFALRDCGR